MANCMNSNDCNAVEVKRDIDGQPQCKYRFCSAHDTAFKLDSIFPNTKLFRRGIQPIYRPEPTQLDLRNTSGSTLALYTELLSGLSIIPSQMDLHPVFCETEKPIFYPLSAGDYEETNQRHRESCPSGYAEISSARSCEVASESVTGNWLYRSFQNLKCPTPGDSTVQDGMMARQLGSVIPDMRYRQECADRCGWKLAMQCVSMV